MAGDLRIAEVNYDAITNNYISFLRDQEEFKDIDFEASAIRRIISLLAYDMHYSAFYANSSFKEHFMDSAVLRSSIVSHAKKYGYVPKSIRAATAIVDVRLENGSSVLNQNIELPKGTLFRGSFADGSGAFDFVTTKSHNIFADSTDITFSDVELTQGAYSSFSYTMDAQKSNQIVELPSSDIDVTSLEVYVQEGSDISRLEKYENGAGLLTDSTGRYYWIEEGPTGNFQIYFGDDIIGKKVGHGKIVKFLYIRTKGVDANNAANFTYSSSTSTFSNYLTTVYSSLNVSTLSKAQGGDDPESIEEIRYRASRYNGSGRNALRTSDYEERILDTFSEISSIKVWDAASLDDPSGKIGKVFLSAIPRNGTYFTDARKTEILNEIQNTIAGTTRCFEFVDPVFIYPKIRTDVTPFTNAISTSDFMKSNIRDAIISYGDGELNKHGADIEISDLTSVIVESDSGIDNIIMNIDLEIRVTPQLNQLFGFSRTFGNKIFEGTVSSGVFEIDNKRGNIIDDSNGNIIFSEEGGTTSTPVGTVNYATGKIEMYPFLVTKAGDGQSNIRISARSKNSNITSSGENILRIEDDNIFTTILTTTSQSIKKY